MHFFWNLLDFIIFLAKIMDSLLVSLGPISINIFLIREGFNMAGSRLDTTVAVSGKNFRLNVSDLVDTEILNPAYNSTTPGRTTIEIVNEGGMPVRVFFEGSDFTEGRLVDAGGTLCYAVTDRVRLFVRGIGGPSELQITELV